METYRLSAPYWINGHANTTGMAIVDDINRRLNDADLTTNRSAYEREIAMLGDDATLLGIEITCS